MSGPKIPNIDALIQAGIDPKTRLPIKISSSDTSMLKDNTKRFLKNIDRQDAINRYKWYNLPCNISGQELERLLYLKGQLCFFYIQQLDEFFFMPYSLDGTIDFYGRYNSIHPIPYAYGGSAKEIKAQEQVLSNIKLKVQYSILDHVATYDEMVGSAVLLYDYSRDLGENIIPRNIVNDSIIDVMAECVPFLRTSLITSTGIKGIRVSDADQSDSVVDASRSIRKAALEGNNLVPIIGTQEMQDVTGSPSGNSEEFMLAMQSLDNLRLSGYGLENGGLFEKKAHTLQSEQDMNTTNVGLVYQDGLSIRQNFCNIVNSIFGLGIRCEPSESVLGVDQDGDGAAFDRNDKEQSGTGGDFNVNNDSDV